LQYFRTAAGNADFRTVSNKPPGNRLSNPGSATGNEGHFSFKIHIHPSFYDA
jgi:hypothetical protein